MSKLKITALVMTSVFIVIQFVRPGRNINSQQQKASITNEIPVSATVMDLLKTSCYDCHSNNTHYPWYVNIQPVAWLMANHIQEGKSELNFDEFGTYSKRRQVSKLKSIANSLTDGTMPLSSYTLMHKDARLTDSSKNAIIAWAFQQKDSLEAR